MKIFPFLKLAFVSALVGNSLEKNSKREKRVVHGYDMWDQQTYHYKAFEYYVWIARTFMCPTLRTFFGFYGKIPGIIAPGSELVRLFQDLGWTPGCNPNKDIRTKCGGSLITPRIVHTACHCVSTPLVYDIRYMYNRVQKDNSLEDHLLVSMGRTKIEDIVYAITVTRVETHVGCAQTSYSPHYYKYDFGYLLLEKSVPDSTGVALGSWGVQLDYAGPYRVLDIVDHSNKVVSEMHVCLIIGFGTTKGNDPTDPGESIKMTHGYVQIMSWWQCYHWLITAFVRCGSNPEQVKRYYIAEYNRSESWVCAKPLPAMNQNSGFGDSGGPVACNGQYFAVVSQTLVYKCELSFIRRVGLIDVYAPISSDNPSLSVEYRRTFDSIMFGGEGTSTTPREDLRKLSNPQNRKLKGVSLNSPKHEISTKYVKNGAVQSYQILSQSWVVSFAAVLDISR